MSAYSYVEVPKMGEDVVAEVAEGKKEEFFHCSGDEDK